ncbi:MAG TPA: fused MFS/spermidine synthase [Stellaceae bacterium]|nr:fused MFS/spermidine synthase [Stellaceae bacterium]
MSSAEAGATGRKSPEHPAAPSHGAVTEPDSARAGVRRPRVALWLATPLLTGATIMAQELVAFRLYAPYFGYSIYVWGSMISVVMAALALGYGLGGWLADRRRTDLSLYLIILAGALYQLGVLFAVHPLLHGLARLGDFAGTMLASLLVFAPPMTAMAAAGPFLIRLLARSGRIGAAAGKVYAISTIGGIAGVLATSFLLVPRLGTQITLEAICILSALTAAAGLTRHLRIVLPALGLLAAALPFVPSASWPRDTLWATESPYNLVRIVRNGRLLLLKLNDSMGVHTIHNLESVWTGHYYDDFALGPLLAPAKRLLVLGMGGGGSIRATRVTAPDIDVDAVEIDPKVVEAAIRFFGLNPRDKRLHIHIADARPWLAQDRGHYDLVQVDLYQGGPYIPFYLVTVEFFTTVSEHMTRGGLLMMNLFDDSPAQELLASTVATLKRVFPSVAVLSSGHGSWMLLAFATATPRSAIRARLQDFADNQVVDRLARRAATQLTDVYVPPGTVVFTDDFAPVEEMTRRMLNGG